MDTQWFCAECGKYSNGLTILDGWILCNECWKRLKDHQK